MTCLIRPARVTTGDHGGACGLVGPFRELVSEFAGAEHGVVLRGEGGLRWTVSPGNWPIWLVWCNGEVRVTDVGETTTNAEVAMVFRRFRARMRLGRMLRAWRRDIGSEPLPALDPDRLDEACRWLRERARTSPG